jgi:hypothetical protein
VIRDGRDVIPSHCDRWGWPAALKAIIKWPRYVATARAAEARLPAGRYHEVRYERLVADPRGTLRSCSSSSVSRGTRSCSPTTSIRTTSPPSAT